MRITFTLVGLFLLTVIFTSSAQAQAEPGPAWQVVRYDISASTSLTDRTLTAHAQTTVRNVGRGSGSRITLRINSKAEIKSAAAGESSSTFRVSPDARTNQQRVEVVLPSAVAPNSTFTVTLVYQLPIVDNTALAAISPLGVQLLPLSSWYPTPANPMSPRGADTAPFRLKVSGAAGDVQLSSGKSNAGAFEQSLNGLPFFVSGNWDVIDGNGESRGISVYLPKGATADERKQAEAMLALAGAAKTFYASLLGPAPDIPIRLIAVTRGSGFCDGGSLLVDVAAFRRPKVDIVTAMQIGEMVGRLWIGGATAIRGEGNGVIREGLVRFMTLQLIEKQFGVATAEAERSRQRAAFVIDAKRDGPLSLTTPLDSFYFSTVSNKGAMVWRLVERAVGRDVFLEILKAQLQSSSPEATGISLGSFKDALAARGGDSVAAMLRFEMDQPSEMDLLVGLPQARGGEWVAAVRNSAPIDVKTTVVAITDRGERLRSDVVIAARSFGEAVFKTSAKPKRVEIDPDKLYPQVDYANDVVPRLTSGEEPFVEATRRYQRQEYAGAESVLRELLETTTNAEDTRVLLGRVLLAQDKLDQAEKEFRAALDLRSPTPVTMAWANVGLGEINLKRGQPAIAAKNFDEAIRASGEYATTLAARTGRIKAEAAAKTSLVPDESARAFIAQLDKAILSGKKAEIEQVLVPGELTQFTKGIVGSQPEIWQTQVIRTEQLDAIHMAVDVNLHVKQLGRELTGNPVLILAKVGNTWKLESVEFFGEVR